MNAVLQDLPAAAQRPALPGALLLPVNLLRPNPWNRQVSEKRVAEIAGSIAKVGLLSPVVVRTAPDAKPGAPLYELIAGEHRWRACQQAGLAEMPALLREMDDLEVIELGLIENLQREGLHELDEAAGYDRLLRKDHGPQSLRGFTSVEALAERLGKSKSYIVQRLRLLQLCPEAVKAFRAGELSFSLALRIARLPDAKDQATATQKILQGWGGNPMTAREADDFIHRSFMLELDRAVFKITDATLLPDAGSCSDCSKRTGANPDLFDDVQKGDTCTDGACYQRKEEAHRARVKAQAEERGLEVIDGAAAKKIKPQQYGDAKGYLELDKVHYRIDGKKTLRKLLAKADVKPVLVEDPHSKALVEMVSEAQATAALKAAGVIKQAKLPTTIASEHERNDKAKRETAWRTAVAEAIAEAARGDAGASDAYRSLLVRRVAVFLWGELHNDTRQRISKLLGWPALNARWDDGPGTTAEQHIGALGDGELCRYLTVATIASESHVGAYSSHDKPERLLATATLLGVDVQACKDSVRQVKKATPDKVAAKRAVKRAAELTPETALAAAVKRAQAKPPAAKYRCPATGSTWSGRGLQPQWLKVALEGGATLESFLVPAPAAKKAAPKATISAAGAAVGLPAGGAQ